jgi:hypothetical protein
MTRLKMLTLCNALKVELAEEKEIAEVLTDHTPEHVWRERYADFLRQLAGIPSRCAAEYPSGDGERWCELSGTEL